MAEVKMTLEEYQDLEDKLSTLARENHNLKQERDAYKKQRDELINDMQNVKRKAEAWDKQKDELREMVTFGCHFEEDTPSKYMNVAYRIVLKIMCELDGTNDFKNLLSDLERGSDE